MQYGISLLIGYLIGSIPSAYLVMKKLHGIDITGSGSGNAGAMNAYEVSESRTIGIIVLILDAAKGFLSVYIPLLIFPEEFVLPALSLQAAVFSHCYNPWLNFKGGRGLATAAGGTIYIFPLILIVWLIIWVMVYLYKKDIHLGNIAATILTMFVIFNISSLAYKTTTPQAESVAELVIFSTSVLLLITIRHIEPLKELLKNPKFLNRTKR